MKRLLLILALGIASASGTQAQATKASASVPGPDAGKEILLVDAACGQCRLGLEGKSCDLAIRLDGKAYFVDGTTVDSHGDAHAKDGLCNAIRKAKVQGELVDNRFKATYFELLPEVAQKDK
jgi:hypothetical protein